MAICPCIQRNLTTLHQVHPTYSLLPTLCWTLNSCFSYIVALSFVKAFSALLICLCHPSDYAYQPCGPCIANLCKLAPTQPRPFSPVSHGREPAQPRTHHLSCRGCPRYVYTPHSVTHGNRICKDAHEEASTQHPVRLWHNISRCACAIRGSTRVTSGGSAITTCTSSHLYGEDSSDGE